jgi:molecular chaperone DnaK
VVAILKKGENRPTVITDSSGCFTFPSIVAYNAAGNLLVGQTAKQQAVANPHNTFYSVKRLIGQRYKDVKDLDLVYRTVEDSQGGVQLVCPATGGWLQPEQVCCRLQELAVALQLIHCSIHAAGDRLDVRHDS